MVSCSSDQDETTITDANASKNSSQTKALSKLESLYNTMVSSQDYIDYDDAIESFVAKMKFSGSSSQIDTEAKMLNWISTNIGSTGFTSYIDAENEWNSIKAQRETVILNNKPFFAELSISTRQDFVILLPEIEPGVQPTNACMDECRATFDAIVDAAQDDFGDSLQLGANDFGMSGDGQTFSRLMAIEKITLTVTVEMAAGEYADCLIGCL
ncbi:hypothetical protein GCM10007424_04040 [Flavobacterium suaedae]|uniref:Imelysin-like domain-containing protein n=2 Tax=Flavobacterium suaedae TaxID=1767027 RepID=A0ABQ1JEZ8_9FLAO|nr:hypothetical protein GCM10007424_04040 [Flavobacterium suaedae]